MATLIRNFVSGDTIYELTNYDSRLFNHLEDVKVDDLLCKHNCRELFKDDKIMQLSKESFDNNGFHSTVTMDEETQFRLGFICGYKSNDSDYKFTLGDMIKAFNYGKTLEPYDSFDCLIEDVLNTRNSIEVKIEIDDRLKIDTSNLEYIVNPNYGKPVIDSNGCIILTRI